MVQICSVQRLVPAVPLSYLELLHAPVLRYVPACPLFGGPESVAESGLYNGRFDQFKANQI